MKRVIIVGATSGIGLKLAELFIASGWRVGLAGRRKELLEKIASLKPTQVVYETIDVTSEDAPTRLNLLIDKLGGLDLYIHSSGVGFQNKNLDPNIDNKTTLTNVYGFTQMVNTAYHYFRDNKVVGQIAIISSVAGTKGIGIAATYSATKRYQNTYIDALEQLSNTEGCKISFTDIKPGFVKTDLLNNEASYPLIMEPSYDADIIYKTILKKRRRIIINWKFKVLIFFWKLVPSFIWKSLKLSVK